MFRWYVVNTYSGHENKVKHNLEHRVVSLGQQRAVRSVVVPTEAVSEMKDNQKVTVEKRTMPGYVLVNMELNEDSWGVVKGTPGRDRLRRRLPGAGAADPDGGRPPAAQGGRDGHPHPRPVLDRRVRQGRLRPAVGLLRRDLRDQRGRRRLKVLVSIFGRETPVEVGFDQVKKL
jgi:transcriptional antiterminator NusG